MITKNIIELIANWVTIIGFPIAITTIFYTIKSIKLAKKVEEGKFLIELRNMFLAHDFVHFNLRNGDWTQNPIPDTIETWGKIDSYLGLFELCEILIKNGSLSEEHFLSQYKYRLKNVIENDQIILKILDERGYWTNLLKLIARLDLLLR